MLKLQGASNQSNKVHMHKCFYKVLLPMGTEMSKRAVAQFEHPVVMPEMQMNTAFLTTLCK